MNASPANRGASGEGIRDAWFRPCRVMLYLFVLSFIQFPQIWLGQETLVYRDFSILCYPAAQFVQESYWNGEIPLWNPNNLCGVPFAAQWFTLAFYPLTLFTVLFPLSWSLGVFCLLHLILGAMGMYFLAYAWWRSRIGATVAAFAFAFNGQMLSSLIWPFYMVSLAWMPWVVWRTELAWRQGGRSCGWAAMCGAMQMLAGPPEVILTTWLILALLFAGRLIARTIPFGVLCLRAGVIVLAVSGLAAVQLLPFFELLQHSSRSAESGGDIWSLPPTGWANLMLPLFYCIPTRVGVFIQTNQQSIASYYPGVAVLALACVGLLLGRSKRAWLLGGITLAGMIYALGPHGFLYPATKELMPGIGMMRYPVKFLLPLLVTLPLLAALAVERFLALPASKTKQAIGCLWGTVLLFVLCLAFLVWFAHAFPIPGAGGSHALDNGIERVLTLFIAAAALSGAVVVNQPALRLLLCLLLPCVLWWDALIHFPGLFKTVPRSAYTLKIPSLEELDPRPVAGHSRALVSFHSQYELHTSMLSDLESNLLITRMSLNYSCNLLEGLSKVGGFFPVELKPSFEVRQAIDYAPNLPAPLADFLGVSQMTKPGEVFEWESRDTFLGMATGGQSAVFLDNAVILNRLLSPDFNPLETVYFDASLANALQSLPQSKVEVSLNQFKNKSLDMTTSSELGGFVVVAQSFYPAWKLTIDGAPAPLYKANHAFQAFHVPAGDHACRLAYQSGAFRLGAWLGTLTLIAILLVLFLGQRPKRRSKSQPPGDD